MPSSNGAFMAPFTASDGIHDTATTLDSIFIARSSCRLTPSSARRTGPPKGGGLASRGWGWHPPVHGCPLAPIGSDVAGWSACPTA